MKDRCLGVALEVKLHTAPSEVTFFSLISATIDWIEVEWARPKHPPHTLFPPRPHFPSWHHVATRPSKGGMGKGGGEWGLKRNGCPTPLFTNTCRCQQCHELRHDDKMLGESIHQTEGGGGRCGACVVHVRLQELLEGLYVHLLQADDVGIKPQDLLQHQGAPVLRCPEPAPGQHSDARSHSVAEDCAPSAVGQNRRLAYAANVKHAIEPSSNQGPGIDPCAIC